MNNVNSESPTRSTSAFGRELQFSCRHPSKTSCCRWVSRIHSAASCACRSDECSGSTCVSSCKGIKDSGTWAPRHIRASSVWRDSSSSCRLCRSSCTDKSSSDNLNSLPCAYLENKKTRKHLVRELFLNTRLFLANSCIAYG